MGMNNGMGMGRPGLGLQGDPRLPRPAYSPSPQIPNLTGDAGPRAQEPTIFPSNYVDMTGDAGQQVNGASPYVRPSRGSRY